jgi:hypothetical protein
MLNNLKQALPQQGNSQADIIFEVLAEGGITRMMALYQDPSSVGFIGSVRSARRYYMELAAGMDAVFIHAGGSPDFYTVRDNSRITTADGSTAAITLNHRLQVAFFCTASFLGEKGFSL